MLNGGEKADLNEQLPAGWTKPAHLGTVDLYQMGSSPPCAKLRMIFEFYGVNYKCWAGKKKDSEYQKVPVVVTNGLQVSLIGTRTHTYSHACTHTLFPSTRGALSFSFSNTSEICVFHT